jgi:hypothetical protein
LLWFTRSQQLEARSLPSTPLQISSHKNLSLALQALISMGHRPGARGAVILKLAVLHRSMLALAGIVQQDPAASIFGYGKTDGVTAALGRKLPALSGVSNVAQLSQLFIIGGEPLGSRGAGTAISGA